MSSQISVQFLPKGKASRKIPDKRMVGKENQIESPAGTVIKEDDGSIWHSFKRSKTWEPAVYHNTIRAALIEFANAQGSFASGGPAREDFPDILFVYKRPYEIKHAGPIRYLYVDGMLVIDSTNRPVRAWPELNLTVSSNVEGFRLEALQRTNPHISAADILARMPPNITKARKGGNEVIPQQLKPNALSMRKRVFRGNHGMLSWTAREGTSEIKNYLDSLLGPELVAQNNTRDMRPLSADETQHMMFVLGKGKHPERSRHKSPNTVAARKCQAEEQKLLKDEPEDSSNSDIPSDLEDHFEPIPADLEDHSQPMEFAGQHHDESSDDDTLSAVEDPVEPLNTIQDQGWTIRESETTSGLDLDDLLDCRNLIPTTLDEKDIVATAIQASIIEYEGWLNMALDIDADNAFRWESYNVQWLYLQQSFEHGWVARGWDLNHCPELSMYPRREGILEDWLVSLFGI
ncbi:MAG: hypothetical protein LQ344_007159 [Seirophora lacunosa]|nr:MAG: hypothetical protein LQ344_007159 [Seirophora lacunosa]